MNLDVVKLNPDRVDPGLIDWTWPEYPRLIHVLRLPPILLIEDKQTVCRVGNSCPRDDTSDDMVTRYGNSIFLRSMKFDRMGKCIALQVWISWKISLSKVFVNKIKKYPFQSFPISHIRKFENSRENFRFPFRSYYEQSIMDRPRQKNHLQYFLLNWDQKEKPSDREGYLLQLSIKKRKKQRERDVTSRSIYPSV